MMTTMNYLLYLYLRCALPLAALCLAHAVHAADSAGPRPLAVKVAAIQCSSVLGDVAGNTKKLMALVGEAATNGAKIIVLPETAVTGYLSQDLKTNWHLPGQPIETKFQGLHPNAFAETVPGPSTERFAALARRLKVYITVPLLEKATNTINLSASSASNLARWLATTNYYNTVCLVSPQGRLVAHYRKLTPWPYPEKSWATPGDRGVQTYDTEYGRVGLAICFDIHTILEKYQPRQIWALLYAIAWVDDDHPAEWFWHRLPQRVAKFNHYVIGANWSVDQEQSWRGYGFSEIISPAGGIVAAAHSLYDSEIVYATIPTAWAKERR